MKKSKLLRSKLIYSLVIAQFCLSQSVFSQAEFPHKEIIKKEVTVNKLDKEVTLFVGNVSGAIDIEGYQGNTIKIELEKSINSNSKRETLKGIDEVKLKVLQEKNAVFVYMDSPYSSMDIQEENYSFKNDCKGKSCYKYTFSLNYKIKVPNSLKLKLQTVDNGNIIVKNMNGSFVQAWNVKGFIDLENISGAVDAKTVEGDIDIVFKNNPTSRCDFATVNGNILAKFKKGIDAEISYQIRKGRFRNDFMKSKNKTQVTDLIKGKIKTGNGSVPINFNLVSGDIDIKSI